MRFIPIVQSDEVPSVTTKFVVALVLKLQTFPPPELPVEPFVAEEVRLQTGQWTDVRELVMTSVKR